MDKCNLHDDSGRRFAICNIFGLGFSTTFLADNKCLVLTKSHGCKESARHLQGKLIRVARATGSSSKTQIHEHACHQRRPEPESGISAMNIFHQFEVSQKTVRVILQVVGFMLTAGLAVILVLIWMLIEPVFQLLEKASHRENIKNQASNRDVIHLGIGLALLVFGILMIIYVFNAYGSVIPDGPGAFAGAPTPKTVGLLLGGSAAVVVGVTLATRSTAKASNRIQPKPSASRNHLQKP